MKLLSVQLLVVAALLLLGTMVSAGTTGSKMSNELEMTDMTSDSNKVWIRDQNYVRVS